MALVVQGLVLVFALFVAGVAASAQSVPKIRMIFPTILDRECARLTKTEVDAAWVQEAIRRTPEFQALWDNLGQKYLETALSEAGLPFPYLEMQVYLSVCPIGITMSTPLLIELAPFLDSTASHAKRRWPTWFLAEVVFHELLHHYVQPVQTVSALRKKYASEAVVTRNHLHVMALERVTFAKLGLASELQFMDRDYRTNSSPEYKRAWEIVADIEGERAFLKEFQLLAAGK